MKILLNNLLFGSILLSTVTPAVIAERAPTFYVNHFLEDSFGQVQTFEDYSHLPEEAVDASEEASTESKPADAVDSASGTSDDVSTKPEPAEAVDSAFSASDDDEEEERDRPFTNDANEKVENASNFPKVITALMVTVFCYKFFTTVPIQKNLTQFQKGLLAYLPKRLLNLFVKANK